MHVPFESPLKSDHMKCLPSGETLTVLQSRYESLDLPLGRFHPCFIDGQCILQ